MTTTSTQRTKATASDTVAGSQPASAAQTPVTANEEAIEAWDGPLFDRFVRFRHIVVAGLTPFRERALADWAPQRAASACSTSAAASATPPSGSPRSWARRARPWESTRPRDSSPPRGTRLLRLGHQRELPRRRRRGRRPRRGL